ncbi:MAG: dihydrofolate reductase, partial [Bacteroidota bacterium]|nr:dihydrofolate reductase [Bacteroidota bacterium]
VAVGENGAIGKNGDLLWHIREDMLYFKNTTKNHPVIMGRKTWESLQVHPLPKRHNIIITKNKEFSFPNENVSVLYSIEEAKKIRDFNTEIFVIGGGSVYKEFMPLANKIYLTKVYKSYKEADTFFPIIKTEEWKVIYQSERKKDEESNLEFQFFTLEKK